jgi:hypothetical protein
MKKSLLLISLILVVFSVSGQQNLKRASAAGLIKQNSGKSATMATTALRITNSLTEDWLVTSVWENSSKTEFTYGTNTETETTSVWDNSTTGVWVLNNKTEYTYDANGNTTLKQTYSYNKALSQWNNSTKTESVYDISNNVIQQIYWMWLGSDWFGLSKNDFTYNAENKPTSDIAYAYNAGTSLWDKKTKTEYLYTVGINTQDLFYKWDLTLPTPDWAISGKTDYLYNGSGKLTTRTTYNWDITLPIPDWVEKDKTEIGYDIAGNQNIIASYTWDAAWYPSIKTEFVFDVNKYVTMITTSLGDALNWVFYSRSEIIYTTNQSVTTTSSWNTGTSLWEVKSRTTDTYSDVTAVEKHTVDGIKVYPNSAGIIIENTEGSGRSTVQIFDLQGRKVLDQKLSGERQVIPAGDYKKGLYIYRITVNGTVTSGKLVIK